ncbi:MAG: DUF4912 domain-containing protein [Treponema sp.]|jgi:hypothetical protein|nr:DUF4912 domain-containing protein [Treponema sp.]
MDEQRLGRSYLESLTTHELAKLADSQGIEIPPGLDRSFIIEELLDLEYESRAGTAEKASPPLAEGRGRESVPLPKQYNITFIEVLIRDPLWVFTFWEINAHDRLLYERASDFGGYCLKVCPIEGPGQQGAFTVSVGIGDSAWYLGFPPSGGSFKVKLCVLRGAAAVVLAASRPFRLPKLLNSSGNMYSSDEKAAPETPKSADAGAFQTPLILLSGLEDFHILRNIDRLSRVPRCCDL